MIEEIVGKLAGSVFQDSYQGFQIRTRVSPRNPQSFFQQLRRGEYGYITQLWRELSDSQRDTWSGGAPSGISAFQWFVTCNCNLSLLDIAPISTYSGSSAPASMNAQINELTTEAFLVSVPSGTTTVPSGHTLIVFASYLRGAQQLFTNPSMFSPVINFPAGTNMASAKDIFTEWTDRFGVLNAERRLCIKTALINNSNGLRTDGAVSCANSTSMAYLSYVAKISQSGTSAPTATEVYNTLGAVTFSYDDVGQYYCLSSNLFTSGKTAIFVSSNNVGGDYSVLCMNYLNGSNILMQSFSRAGAMTDGLLDECQVEIRVYP